MLNHITFYSTSAVMKNELQTFANKLPHDSSIKVNFSTGIVEIGEIRTFHKVLAHNIRDRMQGVHWHGYTFHSSIRMVEADFVHWLNQEVARGQNRWTS